MIDREKLEAVRKSIALASESVDAFTKSYAANDRVNMSEIMQLAAISAYLEQAAADLGTITPESQH